jgi:DNA invertase Pin-like site-specific DNA recombinase
MRIGNFTLAGLRVVIYARYSSELQNPRSTKDQVDRCRAFVQQLGGLVPDELTFCDEAVSGASLHRPAMARLQELAFARPRKIDVIIVEDLSRLSRDAADTFMFIREINFSGVRLLSVADGIDTSDKHAHANIALQAMNAQQTLMTISDKTLRGLEARARQGYATGGVPYGYRAVRPSNPDDRSQGTRIEIDPINAALVREIFDGYRLGKSYVQLAHEMNVREVPPPRAHTKHRRKGWVMSTIRTILTNEAYIGRWSFKRKEWIKRPGTNNRVYRVRDPRDVLLLERPDLRIIDDDLWTAVQTRRRDVATLYTANKDGTPKGKASGVGGVNFPFSGLLVCSLCGAPMIIAGGSSKKYYRCGDFMKRRTCANRTSLREDVVRTALAREFRAQLSSPAIVAFLRETVAELQQERVARAKAEAGTKKTKLATIEKQIENLVAAIADGFGTKSVRDKLTELEPQAEALRAEVQEAEQTTNNTVDVPDADAFLRAIQDVETLLERDPLGARQAIRTFLRDGTIRMAPQPDGTYLAEAEMLPLVLVGEKCRTPGQLEADRACNGLSCRGSQPTGRLHDAGGNARQRSSQTASTRAR